MPPRSFGSVAIRPKAPASAPAISRLSVAASAALSRPGKRHVTERAEMQDLLMSKHDETPLSTRLVTDADEPRRRSRADHPKGQVRTLISVLRRAGAPGACRYIEQDKIVHEAFPHPVDHYGTARSSREGEPRPG